MQAFTDHGEVEGDRVSCTKADAQRVLDQLAAVGVEFDDVVDALEKEGVQKFDASWAELCGDRADGPDRGQAGC